MTHPRPRRRRPVLRAALAWGGFSPPDAREIARFLREQPPLQPPARPDPPQVPGLVALPLLGYRVIRRLQD